MSKPFQHANLGTPMIVMGENARKQEVAEAETAQLLESVRLYGILQPLGVKFEGKSYRLIWGYRRFGIALTLGLKEVPCVILDKDMTEGEFLTIQMIENVARVDLSPFDLWQGAVRLMEANPGWSQVDLGKALSMLPPAVTKMLSPSKCTPEWQGALKAGKVSLGDCYAASRLPLGEQNGLLALRLSGATRDQIVAAEKKTRKPPAEDGVRISRVKIPLTSALSISVAGPPMTLPQLIEALGQAKEAAQKSLKEQLDIRTAMKVWADKAKASS